MTRGSLRLRLMFGGALVLLFALIAVAIGLLYLFERHVTRRLEFELIDHLRSIAATVSVDQDGRASISRGPVDPEFDAPLSGLYWQVNSENGPVLLRSPSLWDGKISLPEDLILDGSVHRHRLQGPNGAVLISVERRLGIDRPDGTVTWLRLVVAADRKIILEARRSFRTDLTLALSLLAVILLAAGWLQLRIGLAPLARLGERVAEIRTGRTSRLQRTVPDEVVPLVDEINALLDLGDKTVEKSRRRAADLAHGLKTPLTALAGDARRLRQRGEIEIADDLESAAAVMRHHVDRELARARIGGAGVTGGGSDVRSVADAVLRTLRRMPGARDKTFRIDVEPGLSAPVDRTDLTELLGNVLDNALRHARNEIRIAACADSGGGVTIAIADDGPGIAPAERETALQPGIRLDETAAGSGLGLAIVSDIVDAYGGTVELSRADIGGLLVTVGLRRHGGRRRDPEPKP